MSVWIHHYELATGSSDNGYTDWEACRREITRIIELKFEVIDHKYHDQIKAALQSENWQEAIRLHNDHNWLNEYLEVKEQ